MSIIAYFRPDPSQSDFVLKYRRLFALIVGSVVMSLGVSASFYLISLSRPVTPEALKTFVAEQQCHDKEVRRILGVYGAGRVVSRIDLLNIKSNCLRREHQAGLVKAQKGALDEH